VPDTIVHLLQRSVERFSDAEAVVHRGRRVSYGQLWQYVCIFGAFIAGQDFEAGDRVALLLENSTEYIAAYYGVLMMGGTVVALNTAAKANELTNNLLHSGARWLVADVQHPELDEVLKAASQKLRLIGVGDGISASDNAFYWNDIMNADDGRTMPGVALEPDAAAAIIYTSGTTGKPKGVTLSHRNLASNTESTLVYLGLTHEDRCLNVLPFYYSYGNSVLHTHLAAGGALLLQNSQAYMHIMLTQIKTERITGFPGVPSTFALILSRFKLSNYDLSGLRYMTQAGGALAPAYIKKLREELPHVRFFVMYGQTEAAPRLAYLPPEKLEHKLGSAGIPIPDVQLEIRDERGNPVPYGVVGEIYARGPNVMLGYWNDPQATAEVIKNGWLKTGDLALMDEEGYIFIQGRSGDMIKSGGHRIHPRDIEDAIAEIDDVSEVAVVGVSDEILGEAIKAVLVVRPDAVLDTVTVKAHCQHRLPAYKVPKYIVFDTQLPRTPSGKIKRYLLAAGDVMEKSDAHGRDHVATGIHE
jgi:long-chain acyl-CoA synthetase